MRRTLLVLALAGAIVPLWAGRSEACSCAHGGPLSQARSADAIFTGTVLRVLGDGPYELRYPVRFESEIAYKGTVRPVMRILSWGGGDAACGVLFEGGKRYTVFAYEHKGRHETNLCTGTTSGTIDEDLYRVTAMPVVGSRPPVPAPGQTESPNRWAWAAVAGGVLAMASAGLIAVRRTRKTRTPT